jgi:hypothetical protein
MIKIVNVVPPSRSADVYQKCEPNVAVNPANPRQIVITAFSLDDPTSSAMLTNHGPLYVSSDGGASWTARLVLPSASGAPVQVNDVTAKFANQHLSGTQELYAGVLPISSTIYPDSAGYVVLRSGDPTVPMTRVYGLSDGDQPYIEAATVLGPVWSADLGKDRVFVGDNAGPSTLVSSLDAATASDPDNFAAWSLDVRGPSGKPSIRPAIHADGAVYAAFFSMSGAPPGTFHVVVVRDNQWGSGAPPFDNLHDLGDGLRGSIVAPNVPIVIYFSPQSDFGYDRLGSDLAIAVDPRNSQRVYVAWGDGATKDTYTIHLSYSTDGGLHWTATGRNIVKAKNPCLAINSRGVVGFSYQQVTGSPGSQRWETHFERSTADDFSTFDSFLLANTSAEPASGQAPTPSPMAGTYLGDYMGLQAAGKDFYGAFSASNYPDPANFYTGAATVYQRYADFASHTLYADAAKTTPVPVSIDPFYYVVTEEEEGMDFYVRDWTDSPMSGDTGVEPSTHPDFFSFSDVWNQQDATAYAPDPTTDRVLGDPAAYGAGNAGHNYAFARIRRNPSATLPKVTVTARFLVSEFGVGSNYMDAGTPDPSDPDVTISGPDPGVHFATGATGPLITPGYKWHLDMTASTHLCVAVEIDSSGDPYVAPGLTGHAPGWPSLDLAVPADNNKAQRNLLVNPGMGFGGFSFYGLAHNATTQTRDMVLIYGTTPDAEQHLVDATVQVIDARGQIARYPFKSGDTLALAGMAPGENRWINVTARLGGDAKELVPITFQELAGAAIVNGFTIAVKPVPLEELIAANVEFHRTAFGRMAAAFRTAGAQEESDAAQRLLQSGRALRAGCVGWLFTLLGRLFGFGPRARARRVRPQITTSSYSAFLRQHAPLVQRALAELLAQQGGDDPFGAQATLGSLARAEDPAQAAPLHATLLHQLDAFFTLLQKAQGDPADVLQMVTWQRELHAQLQSVREQEAAQQVVSRSQAFITGYEAHALTQRQYPALLADLLPLFRATDAQFGGGLAAHIAAIEHAKGSVRALQKAHRDYLLQLRSLAA